MAAEPDETQQLKLVEALKAEVAPTVQQHACLKYFCNEHTYVRYLRARSWDLKKAAKMLHTSLEWRLTYKPHEIRWETVCKEAVTAKQQVYPVTDKAGRPIVLMRPRLENTKDPENQIKFLVYHLELASRLADESGVGKMAWLLDFEGYSLMNAPAIKTSMFCLHMLQNLYPERLGSAVCFHAPTLFTFTWKAVGPFIDPVTKAKISFVSKGPGEKADMDSRYHMDQMEKCMGGGLEADGYNFDYDEYAARMKAYDKQLEAAILAAGQAGHVKGGGTAAAGLAGHDAKGFAQAAVADSESNSSGSASEATGSAHGDKRGGGVLAAELAAKAQV